ncbi:maleylpyruvate isomerase family mycothiol-dependent enzyme [Leucobacter sp. wl10]|uniref:maleylpyruvate isomerase family mycothiol-dependent enzyme n=1 Tax=Leucobacter sp. wl10 TaxID=2304677 RepID=UPI000E5AD7C1|nr:maleylpyruvate isomerase family mycothiol-dependent enzyme [Leucobacter sp. wl10]RGE19305.1 maleylpyruvate isomerase family mycothiol-dependent enzyme [Leucobacter sp. wl10]
MTAVQQPVLTAEQLELRARLGAGARYDAAAAPHEDLLLARQGTAYFLRKLQELRDQDFDAPSRLDGWSHRHLIAHVGYNARGLARLVEWARTGVETPMYTSAEQREREIVHGATLPDRALRHLVDHAVVHLNVEWRDLEDAQWDHRVTTAQGREVPVRETAWMRAREVWVHAADLGSGGSFDDLPPALLDRLIDDVLAAWRRRGEEISLTVAATDRSGDRHVRALGDGGPEVSGTAAAIAGWLARGEAHGLRCSSGEVPAVPRWF